jgi:hypothetical protein
MIGGLQADKPAGAVVHAAGGVAASALPRAPQAPVLPPDINAVTLSRFAPVKKFLNYAVTVH